MAKNNNTTATKNNDTYTVRPNGWTGVKAAKDVAKRLEAQEKAVFNMAALGYYALGKGDGIPAYKEVGAAVCDKPLTAKEFYTIVNRSKQTLSRWIIALELIIEAGDFVEYASGLYPFSYDKIIVYYRNKDAFKDMTKADIFALSAKRLEEMAKAAEEDAEATDAEAEAEATTEDGQDATEAEAETVTVEYGVFNYDGKEYRAPLADIQALVAKAELVK